MRRLAAVLLAVALLSSTGCLLPDNSPRVNIEFGAVPELEGADVLVDGKVVGKLESTGNVTRISFPIGKGRHEVTLRHPRFDCEPVPVNAEMDAQKIRLMAQVSEMASLTPGKPTITLRW